MRRILFGLAVMVGLAAVLRQRREATAVRSGALPGTGAAGRVVGEDDGGTVHGRVAAWRPATAATDLGRTLTRAWAAPLTALGIAAALAGGRMPTWDARHGVLVARGVRGPMRWFLGFQGANAATLGTVVLLRDHVASDRLIAHEALHARQQERLGPAFALAYPVASAIWGYRRNPFEVAARAAARDAGTVSGPPGSP